MLWLLIPGVFHGHTTLYKLTLQSGPALMLPRGPIAELSLYKQVLSSQHVIRHCAFRDWRNTGPTLKNLAVLDLSLLSSFSWDACFLNSAQGNFSTNTTYYFKSHSIRSIWPWQTFSAPRIVLLNSRVQLVWCLILQQFKSFLMFCIRNHSVLSDEKGMRQIVRQTWFSVFFCFLIAV